MGWWQRPQPFCGVKGQTAPVSPPWQGHPWVLGGEGGHPRGPWDLGIPWDPGSPYGDLGTPVSPPLSLVPACISDQSSPTPDSTRKVRLCRDRRSCSRAGGQSQGSAAGSGPPHFHGIPPLFPRDPPHSRCGGCTGRTGAQYGPNPPWADPSFPLPCCDPKGSHGITLCPPALPPPPRTPQPGWGFLCSPGPRDITAARKGRDELEKVGLSRGIFGSWIILILGISSSNAINPTGPQISIWDHHQHRVIPAGQTGAVPVNP